MARAVATLVLLAAVGLLAASLLGGKRQPGSGDYRVDVVFDTAKGVIPGQVAKIAGARVGKIAAVELTDGYKARIELAIDRRFAPFRRDASCSIQPEGLISERFVQCEPGTPDAPPLADGPDGAPTVPVERTTVPIGLTDLFNVLDVPAQQRLRILLSSLGAGFAGRGEDLNAVLLRAAPALQDARKVLATLNGQRAALRRAVVSTDRAVGALARHRRQVRAFVGSSSRFLGRAEGRQAELTDAVRKLPPLLDAARPALARLDTTATAATPVLRDLRASAPALDQTLGRLPAFAAAGTPAVQRLGVAARGGLQAVRRAGPVVALLRRFAAAGLPTGESLARTLVALRDSGTLEGVLKFAYNGGATVALYDDTSHIGATRLTSNVCVPGLPKALDPVVCPSDAAKVPAPAKRRAARGKRHEATAPAPAAPTPPDRTPATPAPPLPKLPKTITVPGLPPIPLPDLLTPGGGGKDDLLGFLLG